VKAAELLKLDLPSWSAGPRSRSAFCRSDAGGLVVAYADDLIPDKGQFRLAFPQSAQLLLSDNDFSGYFGRSFWPASSRAVA
jgi:hypothetical protein